MKKAIVFCSIFLFACSIARSQCSNWLVSDTLGTTGGIACDQNGNIYTAGSTNNNWNFYLNKYNSDGAIQWSLQLPANLYLQAPVIIQVENYLYVSGTFNDTFFIAPGLQLISSEGGSVFLIKFDLNGNVQWARQYMGDFESNSVNSLTNDSLNNIYITGSFTFALDFDSYQLLTSGAETFLSKISPNDGSVEWAIQSTNIRNSDYAAGLTVCVDHENNIIIGGFFQAQIEFGTVSFSSTSYDTGYGLNPYLAKFNSDGNCLWIKGGIGLQSYSILTGVTVDLDDNIYCAGVFDSIITFGNTMLDTSGGTFYYCKYSAVGDLIWARQAANSSSVYQGPLALTIDSSSNLWMVGSVAYPSAFGNYKLNNPGVFIASLDLNGNFESIIGSDEGLISLYNPVVLDAEGNIYTTGFAYSDTLSFFGNLAFLPTDSSSGSFVLKYCTNPTVIKPSCSAHFELTPFISDSTEWFAINDSKGASPVSYMWNWGDGDSSAGIAPYHIYPVAANYNICLSISDSSGCNSSYCDSLNAGSVMISVNVILPTGIKETSFNQTINLYPNPADNQIIIRTNDFKPETFSLFDINGRKIIQGKYVRVIDISSLRNGIYFIELEALGEVRRTKFVKI